MIAMVDGGYLWPPVESDSKVGSGYKALARRRVLILGLFFSLTMAQQQTILIAITVALCATAAMALVAPSGVDNIMSCMFCEVITEAFENEGTPAGVIQAMFKRCNRMGLMEPVCDHFVSSNAKKIFVLAKSGIPPMHICEKLNLCDNTR